MDALRQKLKIFNYRPLVLVFLSLAGGVLVANFIKPQTVATIICICISLAVAIFYSIFHKKIGYIIIFIIMFTLGVGLYHVYITNKTHNISSQVNNICEGRVVSVKSYDNCLSLLVEDVKIEGKKQDYNVTVYYYNTNQDGYIKLEIGSVIKFKIEEHSTIFLYQEDVPNTYNLKNNIGARFNTNEVELVGKDQSLRTRILTKIRRNLRLGLNNSNGEMIYSAMFGDKTELNSELYDAYKMSGVAHLLAVSGLHVGLVVAIICWILNKLRCKGWLKVLIVGFLLFAYAYLCDFSYSIIRASIMAMVLIIAPLLFSEYDLLSSLCFAGCLILLIEPIALFDVGALLSFGCVMGIAMLYPSFRDFIAKLPLLRLLKDGLGISLATIFTTSMTMGQSFGYLQPIGLISNIIIIPVFGVLFTISFVVAICSLILPFICYALIFINPLFEWLNWVIMFIANHSSTLFLPTISFGSVLLFFVVISFGSKYNLKQGLTRYAILAVPVMILSLQLVFL